MTTTTRYPRNGHHRRTGRHHDWRGKGKAGARHTCCPRSCGAGNAEAEDKRHHRTEQVRELQRKYRCPSKGNGGCGWRHHTCRTGRGIHQGTGNRGAAEIRFRKAEDLPPWPKEQELQDLQNRINEQQRNYEKGTIKNGERHFASLARMEADESKLLREKRQYDSRRESRTRVVANLAQEWDKEDFTLEQKQAAIAQTLTAIVIKPAGMGRRFHPDRIEPVWRENHD